MYSTLNTDVYSADKNNNSWWNQKSLVKSIMQNTSYVGGIQPQQQHFLRQHTVYYTQKMHCQKKNISIAKWLTNFTVTLDCRHCVKQP